MKIEMSLSDSSLGLFSMALASLFSALMGLAFFLAHQAEPAFSSLTGSFVRVLTSLFFITFAFLVTQKKSTLFYSPLRHRSLWLWGIFGALTVTTYFSAVPMIGSGMTALLSASSGVFITALSPRLAGQAVSPKNWFAVIGSLAGLMLMCKVGEVGPSAAGFALASTSGFFGGCAYLMIARRKKDYSGSAIMMTWCAAALLAHFLLFATFPTIWPSGARAWLLLIGAGCAASVAQALSAFSFQRAPASSIAAVGYLSPVLSLVLDVVFLEIHPGLRVSAGAGLVLFFGGLFPFIMRSDHKRHECAIVRAVSTGSTH